MANKPKKGDKARNFSIEDQNEKMFTLSDFRGKRVLLSFHPLAWTSVCSAQMKSLEENKSVFDELKTIAVGISVDTTPSKKAWAASLNIKNTRLLSDFWPHGKVAKLYGLFRKDYGVSARANIIVDENQKAAFSKVYKMGELPDIKEISEYLKKMTQ